jgi:hypothetical protein
MTTATIRQQLHSYLEIADDQKVKAFYTLMKEDIEESGVEYTPELKAELDSQYAAYKNGKTKMISSAESKKRIGKILKTRKVPEQGSH